MGTPIKPYLTPIPVGGAFDRVGVDIIKFPKSRSGKQYAVVFMDYLTKWPEVFATTDQTSPTIAKLLVEQVVSRHGVPSELLSDRGTAFLSKLMLDVYELMGIRKTNTTAYHPQTDGLVERFNRTLTGMLAKCVEGNGKDWDQHLQYVLFTYRSSLQHSTGDSPFYLLYGRDPLLPTDEALHVPMDQSTINIGDYKEQMSQRFSMAWRLAHLGIDKAQERQKCSHDKLAKQPIIQIGDRVFVFSPAKKRGKAYKLARPFVGPYCVLKLHPNGVDLQLISKPSSPTIRVALNRIRLCPKEIDKLTNANSGILEQTQQDSNTESEEHDSEEEDVTNSSENDNHGSLDEVTDKDQPAGSINPVNPWSGRLRNKPK